MTQTVKPTDIFIAPFRMPHLGFLIFATCTVFNLLAVSASAQDDCMIAVMTLRPLGLAERDRHIPEVLTDTLADAMANRRDCRIVTQADIAQMMDFEAMKATCAVDSPSCIAEIGGALGVSRVVNGSVASLGNSFKLQIKLHNISTGIVEQRFNRLVSGDAVDLDNTAREAATVLLRDVPSKNDNFTGASKMQPAASGDVHEQFESAARSGGLPAASQKRTQKKSFDSATVAPAPHEDSGAAAMDEPLSAGEKSPAAEPDVFTFGTGIMITGGVILAGSALTLIGGGVAASGAEIAINASLITGNDRDTARYIGIAGLGMAALGGVGVIAGAGVTGTSLFVE